MNELELAEHRIELLRDALEKTLIKIGVLKDEGPYDPIELLSCAEYFEESSFKDKP